MLTVPAGFWTAGEVRLADKLLTFDGSGSPLVIALARLQVGSNEQLVTLLNSVQLAGDGRTVALSVTIPADALNLIAPRREREQARAAVQ